MRTLGKLVVGLVVAVVAYVVLWPAPPPPAAPDNLWRVRAEYTYKGAPLVLEFGLACSSIWADPNMHKHSMDVVGGPRMYGVRTSDGMAVVMSTRNFCDGIRPKEPNGGFPARFLPMTIVYDNPDTLEFGILYASDDAYENPRSVLGMPTVTFEFIDRATFGRLQREGVPNVVRMQEEPSSASKSERHPLLHHVRRGTAVLCWGWKRLEIPESVRSNLRTHWPADRPRYWSIEGSSSHGSESNLAARELGKFLEKAVRDATQLPGKWNSGLSAGIGGFGDRIAGLPRHGGGGTTGVRSGWEPRVHTWYPVRRLSKNRWNEADQRFEPPEFVLDIETSGNQAKGFLYCPSSSPQQSSSEAYRIAAKSAPVNWSVDGEPVANLAARPSVGTVDEYIFERDEYFFRWSGLVSVYY